MKNNQEQQDLLNMQYGDIHTTQGRGEWRERLENLMPNHEITDEVRNVLNKQTDRSLERLEQSYSGLTANNRTRLDEFKVNPAYMMDQLNDMIQNRRKEQQPQGPTYGA